MSERRLYLREASQLRNNRGQWAAYESTGHCVVLAGPGSGKTKTLTLKLARMLAEDVNEPRGIACITYNNECAVELEQRLASLGVYPGRRLFVGTVHSFSLSQVVLPYRKTAQLGLSDDFKVAIRREAEGAFSRALEKTISPTAQASNWRLRMDRYRRTYLDRAGIQWSETNPQLAALVEAYEDELRLINRIDFDDMPLLAVRALHDHDWLRRALLAKYPVLVVDEYQDLGVALHRMVTGLCFSVGMRLFAVGDPDQSIYGFKGAKPELLRQLSDRDDVETVSLHLNYRSGQRLVEASSHVLGEARDATAADEDAEGLVFIHPLRGRYADQAAHAIETIIPEIQARNLDLSLRDVAILYPAAWLGEYVFEAATDHGIPSVRSDRGAPYPRSNRLMRWLEECAQWCSGGWQTGMPRFSQIASTGIRLFAEAVNTEETRLDFHQKLAATLWQQRDPSLSAHSWLRDLREGILAPIVPRCRGMQDEADALDSLIEQAEGDGPLSYMSVAHLAGASPNHDCLHLSSLHSSKGREFEVVILFGLDRGRLPHHSASPHDVLEARRLFYVGFTRARREVHLVYSRREPSPLVIEVEDRLTRDT